jgi:hypothetical protein
MLLHRLFFVCGLGGLVVAACATEGPKDSDDDDGSGGASTSTSASTGPGPTEVCEEQCIPQHLQGEVNYRNLRECLLCFACATACENDHGDACPKGITESPSMCSSLAMSCQECINGGCALVQLADTKFMGICAVNADACSKDIECVALNNCVANCTQTMSSSASVSSTGVGGTMMP